MVRKDEFIAIPIFIMQRGITVERADDFTRNMKWRYFCLCVGANKSLLLVVAIFVVPARHHISMNFSHFERSSRSNKKDEKLD